MNIFDKILYMGKQKQRGGSTDPIVQQFISFSGLLFIVFSIISIILAANGQKLFVVILTIVSALSLLFYSIMQMPDAQSNFGLTIQLYMLSVISVMLFVLASKYKHYTIIFPITFSLLIASVSLMYKFGTSNDGISNGVILMIFGSAVSLVLLLVQQTYVTTKGGENSEKED